MSPHYSSIKFVDQTSRTINGQRSRKLNVPGMSRIRFDKKGVKKTDPSSSASINFPSVVNMPLIFEQELTDLIQPAASYGFQGLKEGTAEDSFNFFDDFEEVGLEEVPSNDDTPSSEKKEAMVPPLTEADNAFQQYNSQNEIRLIMHYAQFMTHFHSLKTPEWNIYAYMGNTLAAQYKPLKYAILAWSALNLSLQEDTPPTIAYQYWEEALNTVMHTNFLESDVPCEHLLCTCNFLIQFDIAVGTRHSKRILRQIWSQLSIGQFFVKEAPGDGPKPRLSPFAYQILSMLLHTDIRSALFTGNISFPDYIASSEKKKRNPNIDYLVTSKVYDDQASNMVRQTTGVSSDVFGSYYPSKFSEEDSLIDQILVISMRDMMMLGRLIRLRNWLNQCGNSTEFDSNSLEQEIDRLLVENQKLFKFTHQGKNVQYGCYMSNALAYSAVILFDRVRRPAVRTSEKCQKAASEILKIAVKMREIAGSGVPGTPLWPVPLFFAGIETTDVIYQKWILDELKEYREERWGLHIDKTVQLLEECLKRQEAEKSRVDVGEVMEATTGVFIL